MIDDPDKEPVKWDEPIISDSPEQAQKECQRRADLYEVELESVTPPSTVKKKPQVYRCNYKEKT